jgi:ATP-binding cassette subfamily C protein CydCD
MHLNLRLLGMTEGMRLRILLTAVVGLVAVGAGVARLAICGVIIAQVFQGAALSTLVVPLASVAALIVLRALFQYMRDAIGHRTAAAIKNRVRRRLYEHSLDLGPGHFDQTRTGDALMSLVEGVETLETFFGQYLPQLLVAAVAPIAIFAYMATLDLQIAGIFLGFALFTLLVPTLLHRWNRRSSLARRDAYGALGAEFLDTIQGLLTLKAFSQSGRRGELLAARARRLYRSTMAVLAANGATSAVSILGIAAGAAVALGWGAVRVSNGDLELRSLLIVLMLGAEVFRPLRELTQLYHQGMIAMSAAEGIFALLDSPVTIRGPETPRGALPVGGDGRAAPGQGKTLAPEIGFEGVSFGYDGGRRPALHDLSFTLHGGETLGLVGPSGAGKSTVLWLMLRLYDPRGGRILLGGRDLRELPLDAIRRQIAVVTQDTYIFDGTVAENLRFGKPDATVEEMEAAARAANAHEFIRALPRTYDTSLGERGVQLSTGQRQRIAIARALLKSAPILVLDEALSSVDAENEAVIQEALERLMEGTTTLIIAHRLSSVVGADRILVLDSGRLVETGRHAELAARGGVYARLMADQQTRPEHDVILASGTSLRRDGLRSKDVGGPSDERPADPDMPGGTHAPADVRLYGGLEVWARLLGLVRQWWGQLVLNFGLGLAQHGTTIGIGAVSALLVGQVFKGGDIAPLLALLGVFVPLMALFTWAESWVSHDLAFRLLAEMRIDLYRKLDPLAPAYLVRRRSGDLVSVVGGDTETVEFFFAHTITPTFVAVLVPVVVLAILAIIAWPLALVLAPFMIAVGASPFYGQGQSVRLEVEVKRRLGELNAHMVDNIQGMREIVSFGQGAARAEEVINMGWRTARYHLRFLKAQAAQASIIEGLTGLGGLAVMATGAWLVVDGQIERELLPLAALLSLSAFLPITDLARTFRQLMETLAATQRIFVVHDEPVPVRDGPGVAAEMAPADSHIAPSLSFEAVSFSYGTGRPPALREVTFDVGAGQTVALVGRSGAGKTTSAHMLMRFWDPDAGKITLGTHDLREFRLDELRRQIALVSQDTFLFNTSVRENLRIGRQEATDAEIEEAARLANAHEFIVAMPDGYDTPVGERGMQVSGGQRQRISIARAVLKDAPVLILDEATSHLDAVNEQQVRTALRRLMEGRTTLVIAHRLSTIRNADRIVVLDAGRVAEEGTHQGLLARNGLYAQLVQTQLVSATGQD